MVNHTPPYINNLVVKILWTQLGSNIACRKTPSMEPYQLTPYVVDAQVNPLNGLKMLDSCSDANLQQLTLPGL